MVDIPVYVRVGVCACAEPSAVGTTRYEETKRLIKQSQVSAAVGVRGQNKVSMLAKDLARQFSGDAPAASTAASTDKQQVARACVRALTSPHSDITMSFCTSYNYVPAAALGVTTCTVYMYMYVMCRLLWAGLVSVHTGCFSSKLKKSLR